MAFTETFAPTAGLLSLCLALTMAVNLGLKPYQLDVEQAFLNNKLDTDIVMELPKGVNIEGHNHVYLQKGVYGLKQAPAIWYKQCKETILSVAPELSCAVSDPCFFHYFGEDRIIIMTICVDDFAIFTNDENWINNFEQKFNKIYTINREPDFEWFLGIRLTWNQDKTAVRLDQPNDLHKALTFYNMVDCGMGRLPLATNFDNSPVEEENLYTGHDFSYPGIIGRLLWIARQTRPDISLAVTLLASFNTKHSNYHVKAAKQVFSYLKRTKDYGLVIRKDPNYDSTKREINFEIYSDSDWGRDKLQRRSVTGYIGYLMGNPITYRACYQPTIALSTAEAEYMAMAEAAKEIKHIDNIFSEITYFKLNKPISMFIDNKAAIAIAKNPICNSKTKHIDIRHHFLRELVSSGIFLPTHVDTEENNADIFTKPLGEPTFTKLMQRLVSTEYFH